VERALICPPHSRLSPLSPEERNQFIQNSVLYGHYEKIVDRKSAYEILKEKAESSGPESQEKLSQTRQTAEPKSEATRLIQAMAKSAAHAIGSQIGRQIIRGALGSIFGGGRKR
jgi:hypothetical protein